MKIEKRLGIVIGVSTAIGFAAEIILHSMEESRGKKFSLHFPDTGRMVELFAATLLTGIVIDHAIEYVDHKTMSPEEKDLAALYSKEKAKIKEGLVRGFKPFEVVWKPSGAIAA